MKHRNQAVDFSIIDFETIDTEILANEAREQVYATTATAEGKDAADAG